MAQDVERQLRDLDYFDWMVRLEAVRQLELMKAESAVDDLADHLLNDESQFVRAAAARALGRIGGGEAVDALISALNDEAFHVRQAALWALGEIGAPAEKALPLVQTLTESPARYPQAELTVSEVAELVVGRIEQAVAEAAEAKAKAEEAKAKAEAAKKAAAEKAAEVGTAETSTEPAAEAIATAEALEEAEEEADEGSTGELSDEEREALRQAALERHQSIVAQMKEAGLEY